MATRFYAKLMHHIESRLIRLHNINSTIESLFLTRLPSFGGAFNNKNELVAFAINHIEDNCCNYQTLKAYPEALKNYVYYAPIYKMNKYYLQNKKLSYVYDGARSITEHSNIQQFLIQKFNFRKAYCSIKITYCWWLKIAVKIIYPFRTLVNNNSVTAILRQEAMQRNQI